VSGETRSEEEAMFKHANTVFPGDKVREVPQGKTASMPREGQVTDADPTSGRVKVAFDDGTSDWVKPEHLTPAGDLR